MHFAVKNQIARKSLVRILRIGVYLKHAVVYVAHVAVTDKKNCYCENKYNEPSRSIGKKHVIIVIFQNNVIFSKFLYIIVYFLLFAI